MTVREEAKWCIQQDGMLAEIRKKIRGGKATYEDTAAYSARAGKLIGALFSRRLPEIPPEEREQLCVELLHDQYIDINAAVDAAQRYLDERLGIQLAPQHAPFDAERGHQIGSSLRDLSKPVETLQRRAKAATETATKAMHDDRMKSEAKFRSRAGLKCTVNRVAAAKCCEWCDQVAGKYTYEDTPPDLWRRHDNCNCTIVYGTRRDRQVLRGTEKKWEIVAEGVGAPEPVRLTPEQARKLQEKHQLKRLTKPAESGTMISGGMFRQTANTGAFSHLPERMSKKHIREIAEKYDIDLSGLTLKIDKNEELLRIRYAGIAAPEQIGLIIFLPNAFKSEEELVRTLFHERVHVMQFKKHGSEYVQLNRRHFEDEAEKLEDEFVAEARKKGLL